MHNLCEIAKIEEGAAPAYRLGRDPDDEPYVNLAIAKQPSFIVTWDGRHLLPLMDDDDFRTRFPGVTILKPPVFLAHVRAEIAKELGYECAAAAVEGDDRRLRQGEKGDRHVCHWQVCKSFT